MGRYSSDGWARRAPRARTGLHWVVDIDGVCIRGEEPVPRGADALASVVARGERVTYLTNNAMVPAGEMAALLRRMGYPAEDGSVLTSPMAAASVLRDLLEPGARVLVVGREALEDAVADAGFCVVAEPPVHAVVVGNTSRFDYGMLHRASTAVRDGAHFVASNADANYPTPDGLLPGAGSLVAAISVAAGRRPLVAGKPEKPLAALVTRRSEGRPVVFIGDATTDVVMARRRRWRAVLVLTGVTEATDLLTVRLLPDALVQDLAAAVDLGRPDALRSGDGWAVAGAGRRRWEARLERSAPPSLRVQGEGPCRLLVAAAAWQRGGRPRPVHVPPDVEEAFALSDAGR